MMGLAVSCAPPQPQQDGLTDTQFVELCIDVLALQTNQDTLSDSLQIARQATFQKHGITKKEVAKFIDDRKKDPPSWEPVLMLLKERLGEQAEIPLQSFPKGKSLKQKNAEQ